MSDVIVSQQDANLVITESAKKSLAISPSVSSSIVITEGKENAVVVSPVAPSLVVITENEENSVVVSPGVISSVVISSRGPQGPGGILGLYGSFIDTTDQPLVSTTAAQPITINTTLENRGVTIASNSRITFELAGTYKVFASVQATNFSNNTAEIDFFLKKNGSTLANSNKTIDLGPRKSIGTPFHNRVTFEYQLTVATNDYVELWWTADHIDIILKTLVASATHPQAPSVILNVAQVMYAQTGTPPGGNAGDLVIKASGVDYDTAWTDAPTVDKLGLDLTAAETVTTGQIAWNATEGTVDIGLLNGATNQLGQETQLLCTNSASTITIANGMAVMFTGANSSTLRLEVQPMDATGDLPGYVFFGVATQTIAPGATGYITTFGKVRGVNTSAFPEDSLLWCDPVNAGQFVLIEPVAPQLKIAAAVVIKSHPTDGVLMVRADTGQNLSDCHDVEVNGGAFDTQYLGWSETYQHWQPYNIPNAAPRSITIAEPQIGDSFTLFRTTQSTVITSAIALVSSGSVTYELRYAADRTTAGTLATTSDTVTNITTGDSATVQNQPIPANRYVWIEITAVSGTVTEFNLSVAF